MNRPDSTRFSVVVWFHYGDQIWVAECFEIPCCSVTGQTSHDAFMHCHEAINDYLDICEEEHLSYPKPGWKRFKQDRLMKLCGADPTLIDFDTWQKEQLESILERCEGENNG